MEYAQARTRILPRQSWESLSHCLAGNESGILMVTVGLPLANSDLKRLPEMLGRLYASTEFGKTIQAMLDVTGDLIGTDSRNFNDLQWIPSHSRTRHRDFHVESDPRYEVGMYQGRLKMFVAATPVRTDLDVEAVCAGFERNIRQHPTIIQCRRKRGLHTFRLSDLISERQFLQTPLYCEFYRHFPIKKLIVSYVDYAPNREVVIALARNTGPNFTDRDCQVMRALTPHFRQAWLNTHGNHQWQTQLESARAVVNHANIACIMLSPEGRVEWMSPLAERYVAEFFPPSTRNRKLLPDALGQWVWRHPLTRRDDLVSEQAAAPWVTQTDQARLEVQIETGPDGQSILYLIRVAIVLSADGFHFPGLTARESEVLYWMAQARTNQAIAQLVSARPRTINKHVQNIFFKLGVANRAEAIVAARSHEAISQ